MAQVHKEWYLQPKFLFAVFTCANVLLYIDRGIVPGATNEFNAFIKSNVDTDTPSVFLGLLQSAFIVGLAIGSSIFGHMVHHHGRFFLTGLGCTIWVVAVILSGLAHYADSYAFLVLARMLSGVGEASLQVNIPPWIQRTAPATEKGIWLAILFTAIPVGTATGYAYSSIMAENLGWQWAYFVEGIFMAPLICFMFFIAPHFPVEEHNKVTNSSSAEEIGTEHAANMDNNTYQAPVPYTEPNTTINPLTSASAIRASSKESFSEPSDKLQIQAPQGLNEDEKLRLRSTSSNANTANVSAQLQSDMAANQRGSITSTSDPHHQHNHHAPTLIEEFGVVFSKPLFLCLVAGYAAQTAMLIGLSTFGSAFMMGLGYFKTQTESSTTFGALICVSGIIATPLGGIVLDRMLAKAMLKAQPSLLHTSAEPHPHTIKTTVGNVMHEKVRISASFSGDPPDEFPEFGENRLASTDEQLFEQGHAGSMRHTLAEPTVPHGEDSDLLKRLKMDAIMQLNTLSSLAGVILLVLCYWCHDKFAFLALVTIGVGILFFCTPAINMGFLLAVPTANQSFGLAMMVVFMHALGDVPSPIIVGYLKDSLAPGCVGNEDDDGAAAATSDSCRDDAEGLRITILAVSLWLLWCVFFFGLAWFLNHFYRRQVEKMNYCSPGGLFCKCIDERCISGHRNNVSDADSDDEEEKDKLLSRLMV